MTSLELSDKILKHFYELPHPALQKLILHRMFIEGVKNKKSCTEIACDFLEKYGGEKEEIYVS